MKTFYKSAIACLIFIAFSCENPDIFIETDMGDQVLNCTRTDEVIKGSVAIEYEFKKQNYYNIDQSITISELAPDTSFLVNVHFDGGTEGYIGIISDENGKTHVTFSMTNATDCEGDVPNGSFCEDNLKDTMEVRLDYPIVLDHEYRLRIWRLEHAPTEKTPWGLYFKDITQYPSYFQNGNNGEEGVIYVGKIWARNASTLTGGTSFVDFNGLSYSPVKCMPLSKVFFSAPTTNNNDPDRSATEKAIIDVTNTNANLNARFKRYTSNGVFEGVEITTGWE